MDAIKQEISICLPKLKIEGSVDLAHFIKTMKIEDIFTVKLVGIVEDEELSFKNIQQKVYLDINEKGLEFSAGTASSLTKALEEEVSPENGLIIYEANMYTDISNHFAKTNVVWKVKNSNKTVSNAKFRVILTDTAFITEFAMEIDGSCYKSHIKGKKVKNVHSVTCTGWRLKPAYVTTQIRSASITEAKTRDCIEFTVTENLQPDSVATFSLTYEEMLQRFDDQYELVLNISPGQIVDSLTIKVNINESQPIRFVKTPPLRSGIDLTASECDKYLDPLSDINMINSKTASIKFHPDPVRQKKMAHYLGKKTSEGLAGQFVVQYDIERDSLNGEVLLQDEYFVHSFAPDDFYSIHKHVIFLLDTSGSMMGSNIEYLKDAVMNILTDLRREDMLSILEFNSQVIVWDIASKMSTSFYEEKIMNFREPFTSLQKCILADPQYASDSIIKNAKEIIQGIRPDGGTFMIGGLESALYLAKMGQLKHTDKNEKLQSVIVFLTDGDPNIGIGPPEEIIELVTHLNKEDKVAIFSLSFGNANSDFLRKLSLRNFGFSRNVYNAPDVSLQLQKNYKQISSLLLHNIKFSYGTEVEDVTKTWFPNYFGGSELVVAGRHTGPSFSGTIDCCGFHGPVTITSTTRTVMSLERLWAFLTMKHLLDERDRGTDSRNITRNAVNLAIKYSYLTDVTSLVIEKPNNTITIVDNQFMNMGPGRYHKNSISQNDHYRLKRKRDSYDDWAKRKMVFRKYCRSSKEYYLGGPSSNTQLCARSDGSKLFSHNEGPTVNKGSTSDNEKKPAEKFIANRPFFVLLELEKDDTNLILFMGHIYKPM